MTQVYLMPYETSKWWKPSNPTVTDRKYANVSIPEGFRQEIERLFDALEQAGIDLGYSSLSEFAKDAMRRRMDQIRETYLNSDKK